MKEILLSRGKVAVIDDEDLPLVSQYNWFAYQRRGIWYAIANLTLPKANRVARQHYNRTLTMHRLILGLLNPKIHVDHKDLNGLNNRKSNLRLCTIQKNQRNRKVRAHHSIGFKGVALAVGNRYRARIAINGKSLHLGYYETAIDAARAYDAAALQYFGKFARTNKMLGLIG